MKYLVVLLVASLFVATYGVKLHQTVDDQVEARFQSFIEKYDKQYTTQTEYLKRLGIFAQNLEMLETLSTIQQKSGKKPTSGAGITKFFDMSPEEFSSKMLLPPTKLEDVPCNINERRKTEILDTSDIPDSWDWRDHGAVTPVKDQGSVGTCWAFSATGNVEGVWQISGKTLVSLSEEQLNDCDQFDCGVFGGWPCRAYQYTIDIGGLISDAEYPYCVGTGACYPCPPKGYNATFCGPPPTYCNETQWPCKANKNSNFAAHISNWVSFGTDEDQLAAQLVKNGPISVLINAEGFPPLQYHEWGIYEPWSCDPSSLDHAVLLVGYGNDDGTPYWLVKNSWGSDWSNLGGFFKMLRGSGTCGINTAATSAVA